jgi:hypothetical protein
MFGKEFDGVGNAFGSSACDADTTASAVICSWAEALSFDAMRSPGTTLGGLLVDENFGT